MELKIKQTALVKILLFLCMTVIPFFQNPNPGNQN
jgi:hypothetical protein